MRLPWGMGTFDDIMTELHRSQYVEIPDSEKCVSCYGLSVKFPVSIFSLHDVSIGCDLVLRVK